MRLYAHSIDGAVGEARSSTDIRRTVHELNNALTTVIANAQLAHSVLGIESDVSEELTDIVGGAGRACELARKLKSLTCGDDERPGADR